MSAPIKMERVYTESAVPTVAASLPSTFSQPIPRSASVSCHTSRAAGGKKQKRTPLYQRSVSGHVGVLPYQSNWCDVFLSNCMSEDLLRSWVHINQSCRLLSRLWICLVWLLIFSHGEKVENLLRAIRSLTIYQLLNVVFVQNQTPFEIVLFLLPWLCTFLLCMLSPFITAGSAFNIWATLAVET